MPHPSKYNPSLWSPQIIENHKAPPPPPLTWQAFRDLVFWPKKTKNPTYYNPLLKTTRFFVRKIFIRKLASTQIPKKMLRKYPASNVAVANFKNNYYA